MGGADPLLSPGHPKPVLLMSILLYLWSCICPFPGHPGVHSVGLVGVSWGLPQTDTSCTSLPAVSCLLPLPAATWTLAPLQAEDWTQPPPGLIAQTSM